MRKLSRMTALIFAAVLALSLCIPVYAHDVPDLDRTGSITVTFHMPVNRRSYGTLTLYRVGEVWEDDGNFSFRAVEELEDDFSFDDLEDAENLAKALSVYVRDTDLEAITEDIHVENQEVLVSFYDLELGLYLAVQNQPASGYKKLTPFLITMPYMEDGVYLYEVDAQAKTELEQEPSGTTPSKPTTPTDPKLPQTGQLNWPVPLMAVLGVGLFAMGWVLCFGKRKRKES